MHASWNYVAKKVSGGVAFVWLFSSLSAALYLPLAAYIWFTQRPDLQPLSFVFMLGTALIHIVYFLVLQRGYRVGDLSLVYPLARGSGPLLSTILAIIIFKERPTPLALAGAGLIIVSVFLLAGGHTLFRQGKSAKTQKAIIYGLTTGLLIATYTLWDKYAVAVLLIPPLIFDWASNFLRSLFLVPSAYQNWQTVRWHWSKHLREILVVATLSPLAYILVLTALRFSPVSYIAPTREISILMGTLLGTSLLKEGDAKRRLSAAFLMVLGVIALALG
ncbi:MAG: EamA family transporter [Trueperaceae bacterium]|nr:EamA family transporter [Trueperaceae bacterium]